jgi:SagB-type dehydrogenase family enzyme
MPAPDPLQVVFAYHERSKHRPDRYAPSLGYMDWATQPDPFRTYEGSERLPLLQPPLLARPTYDELFRAPSLAAQPIDYEAISRLFHDSLALSAWKQAPGTRAWSLRINPSSGALHPTEGYLLAGPIPGLSETPALYHYAPYHHALERRLSMSPEEWAALTAGFPPSFVLIALTSIYWREAWKYGERAFRYCHHDVGHAIGAVVLSARMLGWHTRLIARVGSDDLDLLLGVASQTGPEAEHADCLLLLSLEEPKSAELRLTDDWRERWRQKSFAGTPNRLSQAHHDWPAIDAVAAATRAPSGWLPAPAITLPTRSPALHDRQLSAQQIIRQRRSAVDMDGTTSLPAHVFYALLQRLLPGGMPFAVLPGRSAVSLLLFVHRVDGLQPGLYLLARTAEHESDLRLHLRSDAAWHRPADCPPALPLYLLVAGDARRSARLASCHQDIAADGVFAVALLCQFGPRLKEEGPSGYPRLFWETGLVGQVLYLEAEAAGLRGTGIGCFFDDITHDYAGISDPAWQDLYHFTLGGPVDDPRLQTIPPYGHL